MKHVNMFVLAALLGLAAPAFATNNGVGNECQGNSCGAQGGNGGNGGNGGAGGSSHSDATGVGIGGGADVDVRTSVDTDVRNSANSGSFSGASSNQRQGQEQGQEQSNSQGISAFNGNTTTVEAPDVKGMGKALAQHASSAAEVRGQSSDGETPCGDVSGISAQSGLFGGAFAVPSVACQTFRHEKLQDLYGDRASAKAEAVLFWFPGFLVRLVTYPISH